ncbi:hypothetical protein [Inquilinus sp. CA228]|uniref:hypothetical protein n=1 Tax=Inquilinus sp. CA228 TaxID=3455609 RepID=UPI003F8D418F
MPESCGRAAHRPCGCRRGAIRPCFPGRGKGLLLDIAEGALKARIDAALTAPKADGSLAKLSQRWFGQDYTQD